MQSARYHGHRERGGVWETRIMRLCGHGGWRAEKGMGVAEKRRGSVVWVFR